MSQRLESRIECGEARVAVVGLGYTGLPLARAFVAAGHPVVGFDVDPEKPRALLAGEAYLSHLAEATEELARAESFEATSDPERLGEVDVAMLCVPTPLDTERRPDLSFVTASAEMLARVGGRDRLVVLTSTTWPGTTREVVRPILESGGLESGRDFLLGYSPEREDPGRDSGPVPRLIAGDGVRAAELVGLLFMSTGAPIHLVESCEVAEAAKLFENVYRAVNIALVNELKGIAIGLDIDVWAVLDAAATKPFGFQRFDPGPGMGGHCIPVDPFYLAHAAERAGSEARFVELAGALNREMPLRVADAVRTALFERGTPMDRARVLILGIAYKRDVGDVRESPALPLMARLEEWGAEVCYSDPWVCEAPTTRAFGPSDKRSLSLDAATVAPFDACVLVTDHSAFDYALIANHARLVVDTRGALRRHMAGDPRYVTA